jgi:hypothetical protein
MIKTTHTVTADDMEVTLNDDFVHVVMPSDNRTIRIPWSSAESVIRKISAMESPGEIWDEDISSDLYMHPNPSNPAKWAERDWDEIVGVCFHHTLSQSPHWLFRNYGQSKKRPTGPYTLWITADGRCLKCVSLRSAVWHNHTGNFKNVWLSVGLAGELHKWHPPDIQLARAARLVSDIIRDERFSIEGVEQVRGHDDFYSTTCPGWHEQYGNWTSPSGNWKDNFYALIENSIADQR